MASVAAISMGLLKAPELCLKAPGLLSGVSVCQVGTAGALILIVLCVHPWQGWDSKNKLT